MACAEAPRKSSFRRVYERPDALGLALACYNALATPPRGCLLADGAGAAHILVLEPPANLQICFEHADTVLDLG